MQSLPLKSRLFRVILFFFLLLQLFFYGIPLYGATPWIYLRTNSPKEYSVNAGNTIQGSVITGNGDDVYWETHSMRGSSIEWGENIVSFDQEIIENIPPHEEEEVSYEIVVPETACARDYTVWIQSVLIEYSQGEPIVSGAGVRSNTAGGVRLIITVNSDISCNPEENVRVVFHDIDGDGIWEPSNGESKIELGTANLYGRWTDLLVLATDLSSSTGQFNVPGTVLGALRNFYVVTSLGKFDTEDPTILDKTWEGNLFVDRNGTDSVIVSAIQINNISDYSQISSLVPMRSRNTDQQGTWAGGTISIGPDDKDQIISPIHWDYETAGTDFEYADLDYDGRIDPDDKDHIISPLYWDFPN